VICAVDVVVIAAHNSIAMVPSGFCVFEEAGVATMVVVTVVDVALQHLVWSKAVQPAALPQGVLAETMS